MNRRSILETISSRLSVNLAVFLTTLIIYLLTLYPGLGLIDAGELTAVSRTLGIAHPTGYPLYTILGRLITLLPIGTVAIRTNILSALLSSLGSLFLFLFLSDLLKSRLLALVPTSLIAFSTTIWSVSTVTEVYSLTYLLLTLCLYLYYKRQDRLLFYVLGLTLTNHMIATSFVIPMIVVMILKRRIRIIDPILFLIGVSLYLYLPIRSATGPILDWGDPSNLERLIWHVTGKQYRVWMFTLPFAEVLKNLITAFNRFGRELFYILIPLLILGIIKARKDLLLFLSIIAINIGYSINYSIPDVESYFIPSLVIIAVLAGLGLKRIGKRYLCLLALLPLIHLPGATGHGYHFADDLAKNTLISMKPRSLLICNVWDCYSPLLYYDIVEGRGSDHWMIDKELLRRSWYLKYLKKRYPELYSRCRTQFSRFAEQLDLFEHNLPYNRGLIQHRYEDLIRGLVRAGLEDRSVYFLSPIPDMDLNRALGDLSIRPEGILSRVGAEPDTFDFSRITIRLPRDLDQRHRFLISSVYVKGAYQNYQYHRSKSALRLFQKLTKKLR